MGILIAKTIVIIILWSVIIFYLLWDRELQKFLLSPFSRLKTKTTKKSRKQRKPVTVKPSKIIESDIKPFDSNGHFNENFDTTGLTVSDLRNYKMYKM